LQKGYGPNYDRISGNGMDGHFDLYFLNCLRHKDNLMDSAHQYKVLTAAGLR
jgi:peptidoglycan DL-endopeptidase CwlS